MKTVYRREGGKFVSRKVSDLTADEFIARGWLEELPVEESPVEESPADKKPKRRNRPPKKDDDK